MFGESLVQHRGGDAWVMSTLAPIGSCQLAKLAATHLIGQLER